MLTISPTFDGKRTIPSPEVTAVMLDLLQLTPADKLMEIGTGSGSQTKAFAQTGATVHSIELEPYIDPTIVIGECVYLHAKDAKTGLPDWAPFTAIAATCGLEQIPPAWIQQLAVSGRLVAPIGDVKCQRLTLFRRDLVSLVPKRIGAYVRFQMLRDKPAPYVPKYQPKGVHA